MATRLPDPSEPLTEYEKALLEKLLADPTQFPARFKSWLNDYVGTNASLHVDNLPSLSGEEWRNVADSPGFQNSWVDYDARNVQYMKDVSGWVHLQGLMKSGTVNAVAFTLPEGYRPRDVGDGTTVIAPVISNGALGVLLVQGDGDVILTTGSNVYADLCSIHFRAA